ncbi:MAG: serine/threonine protein kinase [Gammaproteobacteria bacterium]|nr:MAG: serine/threonine protein kinase [Gammaproteobacteria bacterium]
MNDDLVRKDYNALSPDLVLSALEHFGFQTDARIFPLNSYENRVYHIGIEDEEPLIAKFYRPERWTNEAILEEHVFTEQLSEQELPIVTPKKIDGQTLLEYQGYRFAVYPRQGGQSAEPGDLDQIHQLGRLIARIHAIGKTASFQHRPTINPIMYGQKAAHFILDNKFVPEHLEQSYREVTEKLIGDIEKIFSETNQLDWIRGHGDCHYSNILWHRDDGPWFVDFDDCATGPAMQDLWMLLAGSHQEQSLQLSEILDGYNEFCDFNNAEIRLIEPLRTLRLLHYHAWLAKRWIDPTFPKNFAWFNTESFWAEHIGDLKIQQEAIHHTPLTCY